MNNLVSLQSSSLRAGQTFSVDASSLPGGSLRLQAEPVNSGYLSKTDIVSNATGLLETIPPNAFLLRLLLRETAGHSVVVTLGTTSGGSNVAPAAGITLTVPANGTLTVDLTGFLINWFSATAAQALFLASASWGGASVNAQLDFEVGP